MLSGEFPNLFSESEMDYLVSCMMHLDPILIQDNICKGINEDHFLYQWFDQNCFSRIKHHIGHEARLVFGMYLEEHDMWNVHTDAYHCDAYHDRIPYLSMIIPYSVDNRKDLVTHSSTIIFNESSDDFAPPGDSKNWYSALKSRQTPANNAMSHFESDLSHNDASIIKKLTLQKAYKWSLGSVIYWKSTLFHDSDNFKKNGHVSKEAIVLHTYKDKTLA